MEDEDIIFLAMRPDGVLIVIMQRYHDNGGEILAVSSSNGEVIWRFDIKTGDLGPPVAIDIDGKVYYGAGNGYVYHIDREGRLLEKLYVAPEDAEPVYCRINGFAALSNGLFFVISSRTDILHAIGSR